MIIRKATAEDVMSIDRIYRMIHEREAAGLCTTGWLRGIYPTAATAEESIDRDDMYVLEDEGKVYASAIINRIQVPVYYDVDWEIPAEDDEVLVIHTLVVDPSAGRRGYGQSFVEYYCRLGAELGCKTLRLDTNARNSIARAMYSKLGFRETAVVPCIFNGIPDVDLVCLEKAVG